MAEIALLVLNGGSSSLKFGIFLAQRGELHAVFTGAVEGIGRESGRLRMRSAEGRDLVDREHHIAEQADAVAAIAEHLRQLSLPPLAGIGHRVVHGGPSLREHQLITPEVLTQLAAATHFAPLHVPVALKLIAAAQRSFPDAPEFACFDTVFHNTLPEAAARFALPERFWKAGVRRYGFHGLSCESMLHTLGSDAPGRMIVAHLGNGASVTAIAEGASVDTSMGLTPTGGVVMGTRPGDLDPGVLLHLLRTGVGSADELEKLLNKESGLLGVSGVSSDMRALHKASENRSAQLAIEMFCRSVLKTIAGFAAVLGGVDLLVFTGGIGENDAEAREKICGGLGSFGVLLDSTSNSGHADTISSVASRVRVMVIRSQEEAQIARHCYRMLKNS
jgi:acetate kinase